MQRIAAHALVAMAVTPSLAVGSEETLLEEIIVTASFVGINESSATRPIHVLDGAAITEAGVQSLGEHVDALLGVSLHGRAPRCFDLCEIPLGLHERRA